MYWVSRRKAVLTSLDPRARLVLVASLITLAFLATSLTALLPLLLASLTLAALGGVGRRVLAMSKVLVPMVLVAFVLWTYLQSYSLFYRGEGVSLEFGAFMALRLIVLLLVPMVFAMTTTPSELVYALESLKLPRSLVFLFGLSLRHTATMADEYRAIKEAQLSRGLALDRGFLLKRIRNYVPVLIPLIVRSVEMADKVALAMEFKLYGFADRRTRFFARKLGVVDLAVMALSLILVGVCLYLRLVYGGV